MPLPSTMTPIATQTLSADTASITFSNIPQEYTDLVLITDGKITTGGDALGLDYQFNSDTGTNYSKIQLLGSGSTVSSGKDTSATRLNVGIVTQSNQSITKLYIQNYSNTNIFKTTLSNAGAAAGDIRICSGLWRSTSAITTIKIFQVNGHNLTNGFTATIYGIKAA